VIISSSTAVYSSGVLDGPGNDERRARFVDPDGVHLVDNGVGVAALNHIAGSHLHVVARCRSQLVVGAVVTSQAYWARRWSSSGRAR
jgi:hypothetical protein